MTGPPRPPGLRGVPCSSRQFRQLRSALQDNAPRRCREHGVGGPARRDRTTASWSPWCSLFVSVVFSICLRGVGVLGHLKGKPSVLSWPLPNRAYFPDIVGTHSDCAGFAERAHGSIFNIVRRLGRGALTSINEHLMSGSRSVGLLSSFNRSVRWWCRSVENPTGPQKSIGTIALLRRAIGRGRRISDRPPWLAEILGR